MYNVTNVKSHLGRIDSYIPRRSVSLTRHRIAIKGMFL